MHGAPRDEFDLEERLSSPDDDTCAALKALEGDVLVVGAGGKMGPSLARMARRALDEIGAARTGAGARRVIAVSRFGNPETRARLHAQGVETISADVTNAGAVRALPHAANVIWMVGQKFGTSGDPVATWTNNVTAAVYGADHCAGARVVCFSSGNVYPRTPIATGGAIESQSLHADSEYAASCIGRERVFESAARTLGFPLLLYRLFYACDLRYGVVTDIAQRIVRDEPIVLDTPAVNIIWQGDANRLALRALTVAGVPALSLNVTGPVTLVRDLANMLGAALGKTPQFTGIESTNALLANTSALTARLPFAATPPGTLCEWAAQWLLRGERLLGKPTKYDVSDGRF